MHLMHFLANAEVSSSKESAVMAACMLFSSGASVVYKLMLASCFWTSEPIPVAAASFTSKDADWLSRIWTS